MIRSRSTATLLALTRLGAAVVVDRSAAPFGGYWITQAVRGSLTIMFGLDLVTCRWLPERR
jgi:hypothetical protein